MAKILIVDDDEGIRDLLIACMEIWRHETVGVATNLLEAMAEAKVAKEKGVQVAIIDGSLVRGVMETKDGETVAAMLRECVPSVRIIAHNGQETGGYGDIFVPKPSPIKDMESAIEKALAMDLKAT